MAALKKKDDDMRAMEERYKMYLEKARDVSRRLVLAFHTSLGATGSHQLRLFFGCR